MAESILADTRYTARQEVRQAIRQRTTRGMLTFNTGKVQRLEGELWAVPSTRGGFHRVDLEVETCDCEDFAFFGSSAGVACRHIYAAAISNATRRSGVKVQTISTAGDPFAYAGRETPHGCIEGWIYLGFEGEDENGEHAEEIERVPCRRCADSR